MALELKLKRGAVAADLSYFILQDNTGVYNVSTNPGGYGTPNPNRNALALYLFGYYYQSDPKVTTDNPIVISNTIPNSVTEWQIPITADGYVYFTLLGINNWDSATAYVIDDVVFYQNNYYIAIDVSTNLDPVNNPLLWQLISDMTSEDITGNATVYSSTFNAVTNYRAKSCYQTQLFKEAKDNCNCDNSNRAEVRPYTKIFVHLNVAAILCSQQKYVQANDELEFLSKYCASIGCKC